MCERGVEAQQNWCVADLEVKDNQAYFTYHGLRYEGHWPGRSSASWMRVSVECSLPHVHVSDIRTRHLIRLGSDSAKLCLRDLRF